MKNSTNTQQVQIAEDKLMPNATCGSATDGRVKRQ
jgi:hypothetical protein